MPVMIAVLISLGIHVYKVVQNQTPLLKIMIIGISVILLSILVSMVIIKIIVGILGLIIVLYGANRRDT